MDLIPVCTSCRDEDRHAANSAPMNRFLLVPWLWFGSTFPHLCIIGRPALPIMEMLTGTWQQVGNAFERSDFSPTKRARIWPARGSRHLHKRAALAAGPIADKPGSEILIRGFENKRSFGTLSAWECFERTERIADDPPHGGFAVPFRLAKCQWHSDAGDKALCHRASNAERCKSTIY